MRREQQRDEVNYFRCCFTEVSLQQFTAARTVEHVSVNALASLITRQFCLLNGRPLRALTSSLASVRPSCLKIVVKQPTGNVGC